MKKVAGGGGLVVWLLRLIIYVLYMYSIRNMAEQIEKNTLLLQRSSGTKKKFNSCTIVHHIWATFSPLTLDILTVGRQNKTI